MKHRLMEFLAVEMGFTIFSIEASFPESFAVNDYVEHGKGDPAALITGMYFWTWRTEEVRAMVEWMRAHNAQRAKGTPPVRFTGFDMQMPHVAARIVTSFSPDDAELKALYARILTANPGAVPPFGVSGGTLPVDAVRGKTVRLSGKIRTEGAGWAALWLRADKGGRPVAFDNMQTRAPRGDTDWKDHHVEIAVPADAEFVVLGVLLSGPGRAYFDGLTITRDGEAWQPDGYDLDFEGAALRGFHAAAGAYRTRLDADNPAVGARCLCLERVGPAKPKGLDPREAVGLARQALARLEARKDQPGYAWAEQNARVVLQCMQSRAGQVGRDQSMADNVAWILRRNPDAKIVLWAHNGHVARKPGWMGHYLDRKYGKDHVPIGFATRAGTYRAVKSGKGLATAPLAEPPNDSWEARLAALGQPRLFVDLRTAPAELRAPIPMRSIGALVQDRQFYPHRLPQWFDILIYIEKTSAAVELRR
jgi:erythromycin esterase-like protein